MVSIFSPEQSFGELFTLVQNSSLFVDSKTFVDSIPLQTPEEILAEFELVHQQPNFNLKEFVERHFQLPGMLGGDDTQVSAKTSASSQDVLEHIENMWHALTREQDVEDVSSLIALPHPYVVPGGRFREIYYWDSYFTMLGLAEAGHHELVHNMVDNFAYLINLLGFVPNGNRSYYASRSQPPFFSLMVALLADIKDDESLLEKYLPFMRREYEFWMDGELNLTQHGDYYRRCVRVNDAVLNRHWDDWAQPRAESYSEDVEVARHSQRNDEDIYRDIRAACETGWDFCSRWFSQPSDMASIQTTSIIPVDLNCILYEVECIIARAAKHSDEHTHQQFLERAARRKSAIQKYFFDDELQCFGDIQFPSLKPTKVLSLAAAYPLYFSVAEPHQAYACMEVLESQFLKKGGWVTTIENNGHQWDSPNGWAPLQWAVFKGLSNYGYKELAREGATRWLQNIESVYAETGAMFEKYNVESIGRLAGGGEYSVQTGFGWSNAVYVKLFNALKSFT